MDSDRERHLDFLAKHASNAPPTASLAPSQNMSHAIVSAIIRGIGPALKESFMKLHAENETLRAEVAALRAERAADLAALKLDVAQHHADFDKHVANIQAKVAEILEQHGLPSDALRAQPRRLS
jgi:hypothetical protein